MYQTQNIAILFTENFDNLIRVLVILHMYHTYRHIFSMSILYGDDV